MLRIPLCKSLLGLSLTVMQSSKRIDSANPCEQRNDEPHLGWKKPLLTWEAEICENRVSSRQAPPAGMPYSERNRNVSLAIATNQVVK
jgi:hypothetical protein